MEFGVPMKLVELIKICLNKTFNNVRFPIQNYLKGDVLSPLLFNFASQYAIRKVQKDWVEVKVSATHQILVCVHDVNLQADYIDNIKKNTENLIYAGKVDGLNINVEKYMFRSTGFLSVTHHRQDPTVSTYMLFSH
jgi:hypothetical protein